MEHGLEILTDQLTNLRSYARTPWLFDRDNSTVIRQTVQRAGHPQNYSHLRSTSSLVRPSLSRMSKHYGVTQDLSDSSAPVRGIGAAMQPNGHSGAIAKPDMIAGRRVNVSIHHPRIEDALPDQSEFRR